MSDLTERLRFQANVTRMGTAQESVTDCAYMMAAADALVAAEAENAQLREDYGNLAAELGQVVVGYRQQLAAIDALHHRNIFVALCDYCARSWPCPTHRILHPEEEQ